MRRSSIGFHAKEKIMKNVLILNGACKHFGHGGTLTQSFCDLAKTLLSEEGARVEVTLMAEYSDIDAECRKILDADIILLQSPIWAMGMPWRVKKYVDEVMTQPVVCGSDGRSREHPERLYGSGGPLGGKRYMLSTTWNASLRALTQPKEFFSGLGADALLWPWHKQFEYMGLVLGKLPTFCSLDVYKNPKIEEDFRRFKAHLTRHVVPYLKD